MTERPILFTPGNVRAILDGMKAQTRRTIKLPIESRLGVWEPTVIDGYLDKACTKKAVPHVAIWHTRSGRCIGSPYQTGDRLWVRETWATSTALDHVKPSNLLPGFLCQYRAGGSSLHGVDTIQSRGKWRPSIFLPRSACRLVLEITEVRVERLQEISEEDAKAEGAAFVCELCGCDLDTDHGAAVHFGCDDPDCERASHKEGFRRLWESINGEGSWDKNSWVWAITFKQVKA